MVSRNPLGSCRFGLVIPNATRPLPLIPLSPQREGACSNTSYTRSTLTVPKGRDDYSPASHHGCVPSGATPFTASRRLAPLTTLRTWHSIYLHSGRGYAEGSSSGEVGVPLGVSWESAYLSLVRHHSFRCCVGDSSPTPFQLHPPLISSSVVRGHCRPHTVPA